MKVKILFVADIVGKPGRRVLAQWASKLRREHHVVIVNGENAAGGNGITGEIVSDFIDLGVDVISGGNHRWANRDVFSVIDKEERLLRPLNYPPDADIPGRGYGIYPMREGGMIGVVNLLGRVFMKPMECPFQEARRAVEEIRRETPLILVDIHAEATSEKRALGVYLDGQVTAVVGTHTHVQTADERVLPGGTAYITDVGMTGPHDSVIGVKSEIILEGFLTGMPVRHKIATGDVQLNAVSIEADSESGKALSIERIQLKEKVEAGE